MTQRLKDKVALVFGAGAVGTGWGNGKAAAVQYAREGAIVIAIDLNLEAAKETRDIIIDEGGSCEAYACDVTNKDDVSSVVDPVFQAYGRIDILHNNVGLPMMGDVETLTEDDWDRAFDVNLKGVLYTCQRVVPVMKKAGRGSIINISSIAAIRHTGLPYPAYYASKAALNHFTTTLAVDLAPFGVRANTIMPGMMNTPHIYKNISGQYRDDAAMIEARNALVPMGRMGTGWDVAKAAAFLASDDADYITGQSLAVDGGISCRVAR